MDRTFIEELLNKIDDLSESLEEKEQQGENFSIAIELIQELREEIEFRADT